MTYQPKRNECFEYVGEVIEYVEERQCFSCRKRCNPEEQGGTMCMPVTLALLEERPVEDLREEADGGVTCMVHLPDPAVTGGSGASPVESTQGQGSGITFSPLP